MATSLFLAPHNDDESLWGAFTLCRERPLVVVCLRSKVQADRGYGITATEREAETDAAMQILGCDWRQLPYTDDVADWDAVEHDLRAFDVGLEPGRVYAPAVEDGHAHHDALGVLADRVFGADRVTHYLTYTADGKSEGGVEVVPAHLSHVELKLRALACYRTQILEPSCSPHFLRDHREWYAA